MKGIVFTEFLEMVEEIHGYTVADKIIMRGKLLSEGIYTSALNYNAEELHILLHNLYEETGMEINKAMEAFGEKLYKSFYESNSKKLISLNDGTDPLILIKSYLDGKLRKMFLKEELPNIRFSHLNTNRMVIVCSVQEWVASLIDGILHGFIQSTSGIIYKEKIELTSNKLYEFRLSLVEKA